MAGVIRRDTVTDEPVRAVQVAFSSEAPVRDFAGLPQLILLHESQAVDFDRLRSVGSVLWDHDTKLVIGRPENVGLSEAERVGRATVVFDSDPFSEQVFAKVKGGSVRGVSMRFQVEDGFILRDTEVWTSPGGKRFQGPAAVVTKWYPREISLTPIPADSSVGVGRSFEAEDLDMEFFEKLKAWMVKRHLIEADATEDQVWEALGQVPEVNLREALAATQATTDSQHTEGARSNPPVTDNRAVIEMMEFARRMGKPEAALDWIKQGWAMEQVRHSVLEHLISTSPQVDTRARTDVVVDARDKFVAAHQAALTRRVNRLLGGVIKLSDEEQKLGLDVPSDITMDELVRRFCELDKVPGVRAWSREQAATIGLRYLTSGISAVRAMQHSTSDFPYLLENIGNKSLVAGFEQAPTTFQVWGGTLNVTDFKTYSRVKLSEAEEFLINPELMPISESTVGEAKETYSVQTYARRFGISRQAIINDDLAGFSRIPSMFGAAAARTMNKVFYATFLANPTMGEDAKTLFATDHPSGSNLGTAGALAADKLAEMRKLMRLQKGFNPVTPARLNLVPRFFLVPAGLEHTALQLLQATFVPTAVTGVQPNWIQQLQLVVDPALDDNDVDAYYLAADPGMIDTVSAIYLNGNRTPQMTRLEGTSILGVEWVAYFDFGAKVLEHRGLVKNAGAT